MSDLPNGSEIGDWILQRTLKGGRTHLVEVRHRDESRKLRTLQLFAKTTNAKSRADNHQRVIEAVGSRYLPTLEGTGESEDHVFLVYAHFVGDPLTFKMTEAPTWPAIASWLHSISSGLAHLHAKGWSHRGLTPDNVLISDDGRVWLVGLDAATDDDGRRANLPKRSMAYMAPEVFGEGVFDAVRADLYAFGCVAFELLTNKPAFPAATWVSAPNPQQVLEEWKSRIDPLDPGEQHPDWLRAMVRKCTDPDPMHRLPDIETVVAWVESSQATWEPSALAFGSTLPPSARSTLLLQPFVLPDLETPAPAVVFDLYVFRTQLLMAASAAGLAAGVTLATISVLALEVGRFL